MVEVRSALTYGRPDCMPSSLGVIHACVEEHSHVSLVTDAFPLCVLCQLVRWSLRQSTQLGCVCVTMGKRAQSTETDVFQYTTRKGDMFKYEKTLPSLPVPPLAQTLERYVP